MFTQHETIKRIVHKIVSIGMQIQIKNEMRNRPPSIPKEYAIDGTELISDDLEVLIDWAQTIIKEIDGLNSTIETFRTSKRDLVELLTDPNPDIRNLAKLIKESTFNPETSPPNE